MALTPSTSDAIALAQAHPLAAVPASGTTITHDRTSTSDATCNIDPVLLGLPAQASGAAAAVHNAGPRDSVDDLCLLPIVQPSETTPTVADGSALPVTSSTGCTADAITPSTDGSGHRVCESAFAKHLQTYKRKDRLRRACLHFGITAPKSATLDILRARLLQYWYPEPSPKPSRTIVPISSPAEPATLPGDAAGNSELTSFDEEDDEEALIAQYDVQGAAGALLGYDGGDLDEDEEEELEDDMVGSDNEAFNRFRTKTRVQAVKRFENNRRAGGKKTQKANVKSWTIFLNEARTKRQVRDDIVDEHALLLYVNHTADRCKRDRRGNGIPGTRVGASQIKEFFGALRIRKVQDAQDPGLAEKRPATTVRVYDLVKARMDEALRRTHLGLAPAEDAPDIVANTFLEEVTDEQLYSIRLAFLKHREIQIALKGFLAWTLCSASGKRGDDIRALRLCELQPYTFLHPDQMTKVPGILGLQTEDKTGHRGMKTTINPRKICWIAHRDPHMCPLGALALYLHYLYDHYRLQDKVDIDWSVNKSWRQVRLIFGLSPTTILHEFKTGTG
ncbi:hypothetical protein OH77DRAFT_1523594 [Trametes cingulata]|nr:hypothetical protein OH77DRAFT_1523594 [Trametes cingulata]